MKTFLKAMILFLCIFAMTSIALGEQQGDKVWTGTAQNYNPGVFPGFGNDGSGTSVFAVVFPSDPNAQATVFYVDATANNDLIDLKYWGMKSSITTFVLTTADWSGGTTRFLPANPSSVGGVRGVSYVVVDDGAGLVGWAEVDGSTDGAFILSSGISNFAMGTATGVNEQDLSGVTWLAGTRVYPVYQIGRTYIGNGNVTIDSEVGFISAEQGSPLLVTLQGLADDVIAGSGVSNIGSGLTIHGVSVEYRYP